MFLPVITKEAVNRSKHREVKEKLDKAQRKVCASRARINTALPALNLLFSELPDPDSLFESPTDPTPPPLSKEQPQQPPDCEHHLQPSSPPKQPSPLAQQQLNVSSPTPRVLF